MAPDPQPLPTDQLLGPLTDPPFTEDEIRATFDPRPADHPDAHQVDPIAPEVLDRWEVTDTGSAEWAMRWFRRFTLEAREVNAQADAWVADIERFRGEALGRILPGLGFFEGLLIRWGHRRRQADDRTATFTLPSGKVATKRAKPAVTVVDDQAAAHALEEAGYGDHEVDGKELLKWTPKVYVAPLRTLAHIVEQRTEVDGNERVTRFAVWPVDPSTGQPWADDVPLEKRLIPGLSVDPGGITITVSTS